MLGFVGPKNQGRYTNETHVGGERRKMLYSRRRGLQGRGEVGKTAIVGAKLSGNIHKYNDIFLVSLSTVR